jgi:hypothetical protein
MRRAAALLLVAATCLGACGGGALGQQPTFEDASACLAPSAPGTPGEGSVSVLVDRAELIVSVTVTKAERTYAGYRDRVGARQLTLRTLETLKGTAPGAEFVVDDGPCPMLVASEGETFVAFLTNWTYWGPGLRPIGLPVSALRPTSTRTLAQIVSAVRAIRPIDGDVRALFARHGWTAGPIESSGEFDLPPLAEFAVSREISGAAPALMGSLDRYVALASDIGLDMRTAAGKHVALLSFWLEGKKEYSQGAPTGHALILDRSIVAAWVRTIPQGGPFSLRDRAGALASNGDGAPFPPANRFPGGINVASAYGLAKATSLAYKSGAGRNGDITDLARVREFAAALDTTLSTSQARSDRNGTPTTYYLHFRVGSGHVSFEYDSATGLLTSMYDGFAVMPSPAFAALVAALP